MALKLFVTYINGKPSGVATGDSADGVVLAIRQAKLGQKIVEDAPEVLTATDWADAPTADQISAGLGTIIFMTLLQQGQAQQMMQQQHLGRGRRQ